MLCRMLGASTASYYEWLSWVAHLTPAWEPAANTAIWHYVRCLQAKLSKVGNGVTWPSAAIPVRSTWPGNISTNRYSQSCGAIGPSATPTGSLPNYPCWLLQSIYHLACRTHIEKATRWYVLANQVTPRTGQSRLKPTQKWITTSQRCDYHPRRGTLKGRLLPQYIL